MITSVSNQKIKHAVLLRDKAKARNEEGLYVAEGLKMFGEAPLEDLTEIYCKEGIELSIELEEKLLQAKAQGTFVETVTEEVFKKLSDTVTPQGIFLVMKQKKYDLDSLLPGGEKCNYLILEDIQDPGNLGTMIRTAEGAGIKALIMSNQTVDIYNPKTIRSTMGSLYRVPFLYSKDLKATVKKLQENEVSVYAAHLRGEAFYHEISYAQSSAFLIGNEGRGLSDELSECADTLIRIPMEGQLESLNAAVAAALLMYEAKK